MTTPWKVPSFSLPLSWKVFDLISNWEFVCVTAAAGFLGGYNSSTVGLEAAFEVGDGMRSRAPLCHSLYKESVVCKLIKSGYSL
uniref:Uncharacterized protein n=1 Tax=Aegilops tauschii TaxID=37682 RepID=M8BM39_AEGTA